MDKIIQEFSTMYITKSTLASGVMRWSAINSDTEWDLYGERMTLELYQKMLGYIKAKTPPPTPFKSMVCSDYWCGGMPYVSLSHYPDLNGKAVPGTPDKLFIDGKQLKANGRLFDTALGRAVWKSLKKDEIKTKSSTDDERIRISIAFLDLAHKHGEKGEVFKRNSLEDVCAECKKRKGNKIYLDGYLVHLALTRVPVNPRTIMESEDAMTKKSKIETRKEDALSIVEDSDLVEEIDKEALSTKSDVLVEMSDTDTVSTEVEDAPILPVVAEAKRSWKETTKEHSTETTEDDMEDEKDMDKKHKKEMKSFSAEDIANIVKSTLAELVVPKETDTVLEKSALDLATDGLYTSINSAISLRGVTLEQRLESINPALQELGNTISAFVRESMGQVAPVVQSNENGLILEAIANLTNKIDGVATEVATMKAGTNLQPSITKTKVPAPRGISPTLVAQAQTQKAVNPNSIHNIVRRTVSAQLQPE